MSRSTERVRAILWKEWLELRQLRILVWSAIGMPLLFTAIPLAALYGMSLLPSTEMSEFKNLIDLLSKDPEFRALSEAGKFQIAMGRPMSLVMLSLPVLIPSLIASYSIVGEKTSQTLEPLLATPVTTTELLLAKMLTAFIPTVVITWTFAALFALGVSVIALNETVFAYIIGSQWLIAVLLVAPSLSMLAIAVTVGISARAKDPRTAQEAAALLVLPIVIMIPAQLSGIVVLATNIVLIAAVVLAIAAVIAIWFVAQTFNREQILTRWR